MTALLGTKIGMTRVFDSAGRTVPVTAIKADPTIITQIKTIERDGYTAVQVGTGAARHPKQAQDGHTKALKQTPQTLREFRTEDTEGMEIAQAMTVQDVKVGDILKLIGVSKGKGFAGVIKKHHFHRGPETHGSDHHRAPGSIGSMYPQHVLKGKKMPGKMGHEQITVRNVQVIDIDAEQNLILVKGPVPGSRGSLVELSVI